MVKKYDVGSLCACVCVCACLYISVCVCVCMYDLSLSVHVCVCVFLCVCLCVCMFLCLCVCVCICVYDLALAVSVCVCVHMCVWAHKPVYTFIGQRRHQESCSTTLYLSPLFECLSLNLESQCTPLTLLSLPPKSWGYRHMPSYAKLFMWM